MSESTGNPCHRRTVSVAQRWAKDGMPATARALRDCESEELNKWLGTEVGGEPVQVATADDPPKNSNVGSRSFVSEKNANS